MASMFWHFVRYFAGLDVAATQTTAAEREALAQFASGQRSLVEIGVFEGVTSGVIARAMARDGLLWAIDPFLPGRLGICWSKAIASCELREHRSAGRVRLVRRHSSEALSAVPGQLDFIFIDGDHALDAIRRDWTDWSPRVRADGLIALHDTRVSEHAPQVAALGSFRYFESTIRHDPRFEIVEQVDSLSVLRRRPAE